MIIHISGESGAGKSTMMDELTRVVPTNYILKDFDVMLDNFSSVGQFNQGDFQKYLDKFFSEYRNVVLVGMNVRPAGWFNSVKVVRGMAIYHIPADQKYFIDAPNLDKQYMDREIKMYLRDVNNTHMLFVKMINGYVPPLEYYIYRSDSAKIRDIFEDYTFLPWNDIFRKVAKCISL
jgi:ABC-type dipeptide/oligopeptide/nickel transport system ATPase component